MTEQQTPPPDLQNKNVTQVIYGLYAATILGVPTSIVAIIMNYIKREDVAGTLYESHFNWQIRTFWWSLLWGVVGGILILAFGLGLIILGINFIWYVYRIVKGWLRLNEGKPMDA